LLEIFFATDLHGSELCWRKFLNAAKFYGVNVLICGGDMTGKAMIPIVQENGRYELEVKGERMVVGAEEIDAVEGQVRRRGYYPIRVTPEELQELDRHPAVRDAAFQRQILATVERWMDMAEEKLKGTGVRCFVCPGNDDDFDVDNVVARSDLVELGEGRVVELDGFELISTGWANPTPWNTHREEPEDRLRGRIEAMVQQLRDPSLAIFNLHPPPYRSGLDEAPAVDKDMKLMHGGNALRAVGSTAVRGAIDQHQPVLSLHGHVHESKGATKLGRTLSINPGSSYEEGALMGAVVKLDPRKGIKSYQLVTG
jgi:Icc-related predicted phosphoesterase